MIKKNIHDFDITQISQSGQCFRMNRIEENRFSLIAKDKYLELWQQGEEVRLSCTEAEFETSWKTYFDLETDYAKIKASIDPADAYLTAAAASGPGIRILRQDLWEMIITFIISQQNNIPRIKKCVETICTNWGEQRTTENGETYHGFPSPHHLAALTEADLRSSGFGYRSRYILETAKSVSRKETNLDSLFHLPYEEAKKELLKLCGIGVKVADCVCLFALHHVEAFPIDTHIRQVLDTYYPNGFPFERYSDYAGILQQYIFFYDLL